MQRLLSPTILYPNRACNMFRSLPTIRKVPKIPFWKPDPAASTFYLSVRYSHCDPANISGVSGWVRRLMRIRFIRECSRVNDIFKGHFAGEPDKMSKANSMDIEAHVICTPCNMFAGYY